MLQHTDEPDVLVQALREVEQPEERIALFKRLLDAQPNLPLQICAALPAGDAQTYCRHLNRRPHLHERQRPRPVIAPRRKGPADTELDNASSVDNPISRLLPSGDCADATDARACLSMAARRAAEAGDLLAAARHCVGISGEKWSAECLFSSAEAGVEANGSRVYRLATDLCVASAPFRQHCHSHLVSVLARDTPAPTAPPGAWAETREDADLIGAAWAGRDRRMGQLAVDRFWSEALHQSYTGAQPVGNPAAHLPEAAQRHVRAAVAWRLVETGPARPWSAWQDDARAALAHHVAPVAVAPDLSVRADFPHIQDYWGRDDIGEDSIAATFYLTTARRALSADPDEDLQICLLEALARAEGDFIFQAALDPSRPLIDWTARRLERF